jgi:hypothetical protein
MIDYLLCIYLIILILVIIVLTMDNVPFISNNLNLKPLKCCILLTMYIENREDIYYPIVNRWLNETNLDIYIVDSSNKGLSIIHPRLHQFKFKQNDKYTLNNRSNYEITSILKAVDYFKFKEDMVIKVTGKYFIPKLESTIPYIPDADIVLQYRTDTHGQNTEIVGIKSKFITTILNKFVTDDAFETFMYNIKYRYKSYRLPFLKLDQYVKRGDGSELKFL